MRKKTLSYAVTKQIILRLQCMMQTLRRLMLRLVMGVLASAAYWDLQLMALLSAERLRALMAICMCRLTALHLKNSYYQVRPSEGQKSLLIKSIPLLSAYRVEGSHCAILRW